MGRRGGRLRCGWRRVRGELRRGRWCVRRGAGGPGHSRLPAIANSVADRVVVVVQNVTVQECRAGTPSSVTGVDIALRPPEGVMTSANACDELDAAMVTLNISVAIIRWPSVAITSSPIVPVNFDGTVP